MKEEKKISKNIKLLIGALSFSALFLLLKKRALANENMNNNFNFSFIDYTNFFLKSDIEQANILLRDLLSRGFDIDSAKIIVSQKAFESNGFNSNVAQKNNNLGGITWNNNYKNRPGASMGTPRPKNEGGYYVKFDTISNYLTDAIRILNNMGLSNIKDISQFAKIAKQKNYYMSSEVSYKAGLSFWYKKLFS